MQNNLTNRVLAWARQRTWWLYGVVSEHGGSTEMSGEHVDPKLTPWYF